MRFTSVKAASNGSEGTTERVYFDLKRQYTP